MFTTAGEVAALSLQNAFYEREMKKLEWKCEALEKEVKTERKRFDKLQTTFLDVVSVKAGTYGKFTAAVAEKQEATEEPLTAFEEDKINWQAKVMLDADIDAGIEPKPLHVYVEAIKNNRERYLDN
jgi:hypothetical protein